MQFQNNLWRTTQANKNYLSLWEISSYFLYENASHPKQADEKKSEVRWNERFKRGFLHTDATTTKWKRIKKTPNQTKKTPHHHQTKNQNQMESGDPDGLARSVGFWLKGRKLETTGIPSPLCNSKASSQSWTYKRCEQSG